MLARVTVTFADEPGEKVGDELLEIWKSGRVVVVVNGLLRG